MDNMSQDERRKEENEKHHSYEKENKKSYVYKNPRFLSDSLNKIFTKKKDSNE